MTDSQNNPNPMKEMIDLVTRLDQDRIWFTLEHIRDSLMILTAVPGERWEIEFFDDGHIEVERFVSTGSIEGAEALARLFELMGSDNNPES